MVYRHRLNNTLEKTPGHLKCLVFLNCSHIRAGRSTGPTGSIQKPFIRPSRRQQTLSELHTNIFPLIFHLKIFMRQIPHKHTHKLSSPLCKTALAGLFPASDSLLRCWWDSAKHSTSAKRAFRAMAGWVGSWVMLRYAARRSCSSITRACSSNWEREREREILDLEMCKTKLVS